MRGISTLNLLLKGSFFAAALTAGSFNAFSQTTFPPITSDCVQSTDCEPIDIPFELTGGGGSTFGFYGDFTLIAAQGPNANSDFELRSSDVSAGPVKVLYSPGFTASNPQGVIKYTFEVSGTANVDSYRIYLQNAKGELIPVCKGTLTLSGARAVTICGEITNIDPSITADASFRFVFVFEISGQPSHSIIFDNFGSNIFDEGRIVPLPVNFTTLTAKKATKGTQVTFEVADELNVSRYEVQKGTDARSLKTIGIVFAGEKSSYTFTDEEATQGLAFYRIRSVDNDGKFKYSTVISFSNGQSAAVLRAFPMPARNQVTLQHGAIEGKAQISISSEDGRTLKTVVPSTGSMQTSIDLSNLKAGLYLLRLQTSDGAVQTLKVVKQ